jgi:hypothetical protein
MTATVSVLIGIVVGLVLGLTLWRRTRRGSGRDAHGPGIIQDALAEPRPLGLVDIRYYLIPGTQPRYVGIVGGDLRNVRCAEVWVNSENTAMQMARFDEFSISSIIRYEGAKRSPTGQLLRDTIAEELNRKVAGHRPVPPAIAISTGPGELWRFGVRAVVHVAAVQGEPGAGYRQVREVGRCVTNVLAEIDRTQEALQPATVLFPLLGAGQGGGDLGHTIESMLGAMLGYFRNTPASVLRVVYMLAYTDIELAKCQRGLSANPLLQPCEGTPEGVSETLKPRPPAENSDADARRRLQMGFVIDMIGYGSRRGPAQEAVQERLARLVALTLQDCGTEVGTLDHQWSGDGFMALLPADIDPTITLPKLLWSFVERLAEDNQGTTDRIRLRMAVGLGIVGPGPTGFSGSMIVSLARLVDSHPLRMAAREHDDANLVAMVSDQVFGQLIRPGYPGLSAADFRAELVAVKELEEVAWLWIPPRKPSIPD